jgi:hypothetical protein
MAESFEDSNIDHLRDWQENQGSETTDWIRTKEKEREGEGTNSCGDLEELFNDEEELRTQANISCNVGDDPFDLLIAERLEFISVEDESSPSRSIFSLGAPNLLGEKVVDDGLHRRCLAHSVSSAFHPSVSFHQRAKRRRDQTRRSGR